MKRKVLYVALGIACIIVAALAIVAHTDVGALLCGYWILGSDAIDSQVDGGLKTTRPPNAPPIVIKTVGGVEGPYMDFGTSGPSARDVPPVADLGNR